MGIWSCKQQVECDLPVLSALWGCRDLEDSQIVSTGSGLRITELMRFLSAQLTIFCLKVYLSKKGLEIEIES